MLILGVETSCDETAAAVVRDEVTVLSNVVASQHDLHRRYGGVVPEIASRAHLQCITPVIEQAVEEAGVKMSDLDAVAVGNRPGLIGSLLVGVSAAKALAWSLAKPLVGIDHVQSHLFAGFLRRQDATPMQAPGNHPMHAAPGLPPTLQPSLFPALGLVVSGGHTSLFLLNSPLDMRVIGRTIDDAVGEAYDKGAVILGIDYPGGPNLDKLARQATPMTPAQRHTDGFPRSLLGPGNLDFSFSGLKTSLLYAVRGQPVGRGASSTFEKDWRDLSQERRIQLAGAFQDAAIGVVITKIKRALDWMNGQAHPARSILIGGGVSANSMLRREALKLGQDRRVHVVLPAMEYCMDNAAMIAGLAHHRLERGQSDDLFLPAIATTEL